MNLDDAVMPTAPTRAFASDNAAGAHPAILQAVIDANAGHALASAKLDSVICSAPT